MRFGLTTTLLGDGIFAYGPGTSETAGKGLMWFDEYDNAGAGKGYLGSPLGAAYLAVPTLATPDLLGGSGALDTATQVGSWGLSANSGAGYTAAKGFDASQKIAGAGSMRYDIMSVGNGTGGITGSYVSKTLGAAITAGQPYTVKFSAKADRPMNMLVKVKGSADWVTFGTAKLTTAWQTFELVAPATGGGASPQIRFAAAEQVGSVWIDSAQVQQGRQSDIWRRDYQGGTVLVNADDTAATVNLNGSFRKIKGTQVPTINDGSLVTAVTIPPKDGLVLLREAPTPVTDPVANADTYTTGNNTTLAVSAPGVLTNDVAPQGKTLSASSVTAPANGTLSQNADGSFSYVPNARYSGSDSFTYRVYDGTEYSPAATVSITVAAPGVTPPVVTPPVVTPPVVTPPVVTPPPTPVVTAPVAPVTPTPVVTTPTVINKPVVKRVKRSRSRTYSISGSVRLGSVAAVHPASYSAAASSAPVVLEVQIERYVRKHWRVYKKVRVVNPGSSYTTRAKLRSGKYRARTVVSGGSVPTATSAVTKSFKVR
jgi:hypothetical protein